MREITAPWRARPNAPRPLGSSRCAQPPKVIPAPPRENPPSARGHRQPTMSAWLGDELLHENWPIAGTDPLPTTATTRPPPPPPPQCRPPAKSARSSLPSPPTDPARFPPMAPPVPQPAAPIPPTGSHNPWLFSYVRPNSTNPLPPVKPLTRHKSAIPYHKRPPSAAPHFCFQLSAFRFPLCRHLPSAICQLPFAPFQLSALPPSALCPLPHFSFQLSALPSPPSFFPSLPPKTAHHPLTPHDGNRTRNP